jgi:D-alanyl-D-alanine carboxypeptidase
VPAAPVKLAASVTMAPATVPITPIRVAAPIEMPAALRPAPIPQQALAMAPAPAVPDLTATIPPRPVTVRGGWIIQVGAFPEPEKAQERIREAQTMAKDLLANTDPFTEKVVKGSQELYRARFAGFNQSSAEAACSYFKRNAVDCIFMKR